MKARMCSLLDIRRLVQSNVAWLYLNGKLSSFVGFAEVVDNIFWENIKKFFGLLFLHSIYLIVIKLLVFNKQDILKAIISVECMAKLGKLKIYLRRMLGQM